MQIGINFDDELYRQVQEAARILGLTKGKDNPNMSATAIELIRRGLTTLPGQPAGNAARELAENDPGAIDEMIASMIEVAQHHERVVTAVDGE